MNTRICGDGLVILFAGMAIALAGCSGPPDRMNSSFTMRNGQPIPAALPDPENWTFLGSQTVPGQYQKQKWVKPAQTQQRQLETAVGATAGDGTESFEYQDLRRPAVSPAEYLDTFKALQSRDCPSGTVTPIHVDSAELLLEAKSGGCARFGNQAEIDRFLFGKTDLFHMVYTINSLEMTPDQRALGIKAVNDWNLSK